MRKDIMILISVLFFSCGTEKQSNELNVYREVEPSFLYLARHNYLCEKYLRQPKNLTVLHETFKKFGYEKMISGSNLNDIFFRKDYFRIRDIFVKKNILVILDSLEITYKMQEIDNKYFREFWLRRETEKNDSIIYVIVKEINSILRKQTVLVNHKLVNDTLHDLLTLNFGMRDVTIEQAIIDFETLKNYNFHQSAYNFIHQKNEYDNLSLNIDSLVLTLDTLKNSSRVWVKDFANKDSLNYYNKIGLVRSFLKKWVE